MKEKQETKPIISLDWCEDTLTENLPWDADQYVTVRRLTAKERRQRLAIAAKMETKDLAADSFTVGSNLDAMKEFEYQHCIVDYKLKSFKNGKECVHTFSKNPDVNQEVYDHFSPELEEFVDELIAKVNKETGLRAPNQEVEAIEGK